jgi:uncharacterized protein
MNDFKPLDLDDKEILAPFFSQDPPETSELTFTNLFIWRHCYRPVWTSWKDCLLIIMSPSNVVPFGLTPVGSGNKTAALELISRELKKLGHDGRICRAGEPFCRKYLDTDRYWLEEDRDQSDYVYLSKDLIELAGNKYHGKKNHLNRFVKNYQFEYKRLDAGLVEHFLELQNSWCELRNCLEDPELLAEDRAVYEALTNQGHLDFTGGAVLIDSKGEAFALGEPLNEDTMVIHIEKANPEIPGLYAAINQRFCEDACAPFTYVNREQDLGAAGLRKAKQSYHPHHLVKKFTLLPKN